TGGNPAYDELLVSRDAKTTALLVTFERDTRYHELLNRRTELSTKELHKTIGNKEAEELAHIRQQFSDYGAERQVRNAQRVRSEEHTSELQSRFDLVC